MKIYLTIGLFFYTVLISCNSYEKVHITSWDGAFFIDSNTIGAVGWEEDVDQGTTDWAVSSYFNSVQYLYIMTINPRETRLEAVLMEGGDESVDSRSVLYRHPWVYYMTRKTKNEIGRYNLTTKENELLSNTGENIKPQYLRTISIMGNLLSYKSSADYPERLYNLEQKRDIDSAWMYRWVYIDDQISNRCILLGKDNGLLDQWLLLSVVNSDLVDTISQNWFGFYMGSGEMARVSIFKNSSNIICAIDNDSLLERRIVIDTLDIGNDFRQGTIDYSSSSGSYIYRKDDNYYLGNIYDDFEPHPIFIASRVLR